MAILNRGAIPAPPDLAREVVAVPSLGGDVVVVELMLEDRIEFENTMLKHRNARSVFTIVPHLLALSVMVEDDKPGEGDEPPVDVPLYSVKGWRTWGARHRDEAVDLFNRAMKLSGFDADDNAKN